MEKKIPLLLEGKQWILTLNKILLAGLQMMKLIEMVKLMILTSIPWVPTRKNSLLKLMKMC